MFCITRYPLTNLHAMMSIDPLRSGLKGFDRTPRGGLENPLLLTMSTSSFIFIYETSIPSSRI